MPGRSKITSAPPGAVEDVLRQVGENIRIARTRRRLRLEDVARRMGASRLTLADVEKGKPGASAAAYFGALWALGLIHDGYELANPDKDEEGKALELSRLPQKVKRRTRLRT